jgi:hypothetical protein
MKAVNIRKYIILSVIVHHRKIDHHGTTDNMPIYVNT